MSIEDVWMITCWSDEMLEKKGITVDCNGLMVMHMDYWR